MRLFEKISFEQFKKDVIDDITIYNEYKKPKRSTIGSAGYDLFALEDIVIKPGDTYKTPTGIKASMYKDEVLLIIIRSSIGYKKNVILPNQVGVIDSDYYNNISNEGHIFVPMKNNSNEIFILNKGEAFAQGIFTKYLTVEDEEEIKEIRIGGIGSTNGGVK